MKTQKIGAKTLGELIDFLQDVLDEYPEHEDSVVLTQDESGLIEGYVTGVDLANGPWIIFEEVEV